MPITRNKLKEIIKNSAFAASTTDEETTNLLAGVETVDKVLVGNFTGEVSGERCDCPITLAGYFVPHTNSTTGTVTKNYSSRLAKFYCRFDSNFTSWEESAADKILVDNWQNFFEPNYVTIIDE